MKQVDVLIIGSGPAGQAAAIQAARSSRRVILIEKERQLGGACVYHGTIPSKALRESALQMRSLERHADAFQFSLKDDLQVATMMRNVDAVLAAHARVMTEQLVRHEVTVVHGRASFVSDHVVEVLAVDGTVTPYRAEKLIIATGSRPAHDPSVPVDHENIMDSDSILSLIYLPRTLTVLGGTVIACEYASIFAALGVEVTIIDKGPKPLAFLGDCLIEEFVREFENNGGRYLGEQRPRSVSLDGVSHVVTELADGEKITTEKMLYAMGRSANLEKLGLDSVGLVPTMHGHLEVDHVGRTPRGHIYAVGDVAGPPALASSAMEQGRRAACHACGNDPGGPAENIPIGIYGIPELASIGLTEAEALERHSTVITGRALFSEIARGQISGIRDGFLELVCNPEDHRILGVQIVGEGATELIHIGEMALMKRSTIEDLVEGVFNFPTFAQAYRNATLDALDKMSARV